MKLRFFNIDLHVSVIEDVKTIWKELFHNIEIIDWSISGHAHLFQHSIVGDNPILNRGTWRQFNDALIHTFHQQFNNFLGQFDGFIITHTPIFAMLFEKYEKPIIIVNSCRYHQPICWNQDWKMLERFHHVLGNLASKQLLTVIHNNRADEYFFNQTVANPHIRQYYIPSLCRYIQCSYNPILDTILVDDPQNILHSIQSPFLRRKSGPYEWKNLYQNRAVIVIPREASYMTFFEYLEACIPILIPTKEFLWELIHKHGLRLGTLHSYNMHENLGVWIDRADYFDKEVFNLCMSFHSFEHLSNMLKDPQLPHQLKIKHQDMIERRKMHTVLVFEKWYDIFHIDYFEFVQYNFWTCLAKYHLDVDYSNEPLCQPFYKYNPIDKEESLKSIRANDLIFVKTDLLHQFMLLILPKIKCQYRILLGVSDLSPSQFHIRTLIDDPLCTNIYSTNVLQLHPKIRPIPIGFSEPMRHNGNPCLLRKWFLKSHQSCQKKDIDLFIRKFSVTTIVRKHYEDDIAKFLSKDHKFLNTVHLTFVTKNSEELHTYLHRSKFAIVLRGNGIDTHYFYECILNECVPIFLNDVEFPLYKQFKSCIQIQTIEELHDKYPKEVLDTFYENIDWTNEKKYLLRRTYRDLR